MNLEISEACKAQILYFIVRNVYFFSMFLRTSGIFLMYIFIEKAYHHIKILIHLFIQFKKLHFELLYFEIYCANTTNQMPFIDHKNQMLSLDHKSHLEYL